MTNLTETTFYTRKAFKYGTIALILFLSLRIVLKTGGDVWRKVHPPVPPPPTVYFGNLPKLAFPEQAPPVNERKLTFKLETIQGGLPKLPEIGKVYFMPQKASNFLDPQRATTLAQKMGFRDQPEVVSETLYRWKTQTIPETTLEMDINIQNFRLLYDYKNDPELLTNKNLPSNQQAAQEAKNFLVTNGLLPEDLANGTAEFEYLRLDGLELSPVLSLSEADFVRVNLFRPNLDETKILPPNPKKSLISFLLSGSRTPGKRVVAIDYAYFPVEKEIFATYPLKPITQAWNELQDGKGYIANIGQDNNDQITIRRVYLAFYDSPQPQNYLQLVYVFEGDRNFFAYVPAVSPKWTE